MEFDIGTFSDDHFQPPSRRKPPALNRKDMVLRGTILRILYHHFTHFAARGTGRSLESVVYDYTHWIEPDLESRYFAEAAMTAEEITAFVASSGETGEYSHDFGSDISKVRDCCDHRRVIRSILEDFSHDPSGTKHEAIYDSIDNDPLVFIMKKQGHGKARKYLVRRRGVEE